MRTFVSLAAAVALTATVVRAQAPSTAGPAPTGLVVGSGNFFSPIVADLDRAVNFYRDVLGVVVAPMPSNADENPALRAMFGVPDARLRWNVGRPASMRTGVEIVEITKVARRVAERRLQDGGAFTLVAIVRDLDATMVKLKALGAPVVSTGGVPVTVGMGTGKARAVIVKDPDGHFIELVQPDTLPVGAPADANVLEVRVRVTVDDAEKAMRLYRDVLGMQQRTLSAWASDTAVMRMFGLERGQYRFGIAAIPTTGLLFEVIEFKDLDRRDVRSDIQDPGSTRIQLQVRDTEATIAALKGAGGTVVSTGGGVVELPGRAAPTKVSIVRDPNNLFLVLIQTAPPRN